MSRELNPELFPEASGASRPATPSQGRHEGGATMAAVSAEDLRFLMVQLEGLKRKVKELEGKLEITNTRLGDFAGGAKVKFERLAGVTQRLEEYTKSGMHDLASKLTQMISRVNERKVGDAKIQELVDRHNQLVQNFELRLGQMQKVIAEQEVQLMNSRTELQAAQRELARLKRV